MPFHRLRRVIQGQGGSTLIELLVAMPIAIVLVGIVVQSLGVAGKRQSEVERHTSALTQGQLGLERMTRELRQAVAIRYTSSSLIDVDALVRATATGTAVHRHVRYDCGGPSCIRYEGPLPITAGLFDKSEVVVGAPPDDARTVYGTLVGHDVFTQARFNTQTGAITAENSKPNIILVRVQLAIKGRSRPIELQDGVSLRNLSTFQ